VSILGANQNGSTRILVGIIAVTTRFQAEWL
jgi:hypothetical protein